MEKKTAWKIRLPEKSLKNQQNRRFFGEKSENSDFFFFFCGHIGRALHALGGTFLEGKSGDLSPIK